MKQFGNPPLSKTTPPSLSTKPLFLSNFFMTPLFVRISKTRNLPPNFRWGGEETMRIHWVSESPHSKLLALNRLGS